MIVVGQIIKIAFLVFLPVWLAVRVKRHPEKDERMKKEMAKQRGAEYEAGMQKFLMVNYLTIGFVFAMKVLLEIIFGMDEFPLWLIAGCVICLVFVITQRRFNGEFSKFAMVFFAFWLVFTIVSIIIDIKVRKPATVEVSGDYITAKGSGFSASIPIADIATTTILSDWPATYLHNNGFSTDKVNNGPFRLKSGESCMMFLCVDGGPVLEVRTVDSVLYYLNCATEEETLEMITKVKELMNARLSDTRRETVGLVPHFEVPRPVSNKTGSIILNSYLIK